MVWTFILQLWILSSIKMFYKTEVRSTPSTFHIYLEWLLGLFTITKTPLSFFWYPQTHLLTTGCHYNPFMNKVKRQNDLNIVLVSLASTFTAYMRRASFQLSWATEINFTWWPILYILSLQLFSQQMSRIIWSNHSFYMLLIQQF